MIHDSYPIKAFKDAQAFEKWLAANYNKKDGLWLKIAKLKSGIRTVNYTEALDIALCYGWIDGLRRGLDENYFVQKFTPRRQKSQWSSVNKNKVAQLINEGRMKDAGLAAIEDAKKNGQWENAYFPQSDIAIPDDLKAALDKNKKAKDFFAQLSSQNRYAILYRLHQVKREETKKKKIKEYIAMLAKKETIYPQ